MSPAAGDWPVEHRSSSAAALHELWPPQEQADRRAIAVCDVTGPTALVLGSTQADEVAEPSALEAAGIALVRRRSGGGAVLVAPGRQVWLDAWLPREDPLWDDDIVRAAQWFGDAWAAALHVLGATSTTSSTGPLELRVHRGRAVATPWSATICFAGLGPGEVSLDNRKIVGIAQRRTRWGARLHGMALLEWEPVSLPALLSLDARARAAAAADTASSAAGLREVLPGIDDGRLSANDVADEVLRQLPSGA